jgi:transcription antitermination factor NusG
MSGAMSTAPIEWTAEPSVPFIENTVEEACWYAIRTRCRFEQKAATHLQNKGIETFLPLVQQVHRWSDRRQIVHVPLFAGYGFVRLSDSPAHKLRVLQTVGVNGFVMMNGSPVPVPEQQLEDVRLLLVHEIACRAYPFLKVGQRVRIRGGCLDGLEGILISENKNHSLVISIESIQRSLAILIEGYDVEAV